MHPHQIGQLRADMLVGWGGLFFLYCRDVPTVTRQVVKETPPERGLLFAYVLLRPFMTTNRTK